MSTRATRTLHETLRFINNGHVATRHTITGGHLYTLSGHGLIEKLEEVTVPQGWRCTALGQYIAVRATELILGKQPRALVEGAWLELKDIKACGEGVDQSDLVVESRVVYDIDLPQLAALDACHSSNVPAEDVLWTVVEHYLGDELSECFESESELSRFITTWWRHRDRIEVVMKRVETVLKRAGFDRIGPKTGS